MELFDILYEIRLSSWIIGILFPLVLYWYSTRNHNFWKNKGIPFVKAYPFIGSDIHMFSKSIEEVEIERYEEYGSIYGYCRGNIPAISIGDPELLRNILVKDFQYFTTRAKMDANEPIVSKMLSVINGEDWKRIRTIVSPTFTTGKIKKVMSIFEECSRSLIQNFKKASANGKSVDVMKIFGAFTVDVIASSAFSTKLDSHNDPENIFVKRAKNAFTVKMGPKFLLFVLFPNIMKKLGVSFFDQDIMKFFKNVTLEIIEQRKKTGQTRNDFLQLLMDTAKEVEEEKLDDKSEDIIANYGDESDNHSVFKNVSNKHLTMDELVAQCVIFFLAGYHTSATTLGMATYLLAFNTDAQEKLFNEIKESLSETNGKITYESVQKMKYLDNVISETLRMYSPVIRLFRIADADYKLGDKGFTIPKGMAVGIPIYAMHRDPKFFPEPERFNPDRFDTEQRDKLVPYAFLPFGAGPRNCVGMRFALIELKVCLIYVFSHFKARKCTDTEIPLKFGQASGLLQPKSVHLCMEPRDDCPLKS